MKMKDKETVREYDGRLMGVLNHVRLLGEPFPDNKVVEKIIIFVPQRLEAKFSAIEESHDLTTLSIVELTSKLHAHEQIDTLRGANASESAFHAIQNNSKKPFDKNPSKTTKESYRTMLRGLPFLYVVCVKRLIMQYKIDGSNIKKIS